METIKQIKVTSVTPESTPRKFNSSLGRSYQPTAPSRVFVDFGEDVWTHLANRRSRDYNTLRPLIAAKLREMGVEFVKLSWSRYAGCSMCPCSGGFIIDDGKNWRSDGKDYWAKVETVDLEAELIAFA
jgi:hypothetical protein